MSQELKIEVGKSYRTRGGWKATVVWDKCPTPFTLVVIHHEANGAVAQVHAENGRWLVSVENTKDLIAPWVDKPLEGSAEWANLLPVGTRITRKNWCRNAYLLRCDKGWVSSNGVEWDVNRFAADGWTIYTRPIITDWPKWAKAAAVDEKGGWYWYDYIPNTNGRQSTWSIDGGFYSQMHPSEIPAWSGDWKDSLVVKEEGR